MRTLFLLALAALAGATLATAAAQSTNDTNSTSGPGAAARLEWQREHFQNLTEFRRDALRSFEENRTLLRAQTEANFSEIRTAFFEGKAQAVADCLAAKPYVPCITQKLAALRATALLDHANATKDWVARIAQVRDASLALFQQEKDAWEAAHPRP